MFEIVKNTFKESNWSNRFLVGTQFEMLESKTGMIDCIFYMPDYKDRKSFFVPSLNDLNQSNLRIYDGNAIDFIEYKRIDNSFEAYYNQSIICEIELKLYLHEVKINEQIEHLRIDEFFKMLSKFKKVELVNIKANLRHDSKLCYFLGALLTDKKIKYANI